MKIKTYKNGHATMEQLFPSGMYLVRLRIGTELIDKVRLDDYKEALACFHTFAAQAKNA